MRKFGAVLQVEFISLICFGALFFLTYTDYFQNKHEVFHYTSCFLSAIPSCFPNPVGSGINFFCLTLLTIPFLKFLPPWLPGQDSLWYLPSFLVTCLYPPHRVPFYSSTPYIFVSPALHSCLIIPPHLW